MTRWEREEDDTENRSRSRSSSRPRGKKTDLRVVVQILFGPYELASCFVVGRTKKGLEYLEGRRSGQRLCWRKAFTVDTQTLTS